NEEVTAGLDALVRSTGCKVVAPRAGLDAVRPMCPDGTEILTEEGLEKAGWFKVRAIPLAGRGRAPLAYRVRWSNKTVLLSGRIPAGAAEPTELTPRRSAKVPGFFSELPVGEPIAPRRLTETMSQRPVLRIALVAVAGLAIGLALLLILRREPDEPDEPDQRS